MRRGLEMIYHAIRAGEALLTARAQVERGGWLDWMERNLTMDVTTGYRYMRIAEYRQQVIESKVESIERAIVLLADQPRRGHGPRGYTDADKADWIKLVDQVGVKRAAAALGVAPSTISKWASPISPYRGSSRARPTSSLHISDESIERLGQWLVDRFGGYDYPERITDQVRADALAALERAFDIPPLPSEAERPVAGAALDAAGVESSA